MSLLLAQPIDTSDPLLLADADIAAVAAPINGDLGDSYYRAIWQRVRLSDRLTMPHLMGFVDRGDPTAIEVWGSYADPFSDIDASANEPLLVEVEIFTPPDDSYISEDLDPDLYRVARAATEAELMDAPFDWDGLMEGAA